MDETMHSPRTHRQRRMLAGAVALATVLGATAVGSGALAKAPLRAEASLTDASAEPAGVFVAVASCACSNPSGPRGTIGVASPGISAIIDEDLRLDGDGFAIPATARRRCEHHIDDDAECKLLHVWHSENRGENARQPRTDGPRRGELDAGQVGTTRSASSTSRLREKRRDVVGYRVPLRRPTGVVPTAIGCRRAGKHVGSTVTSTSTAPMAYLRPRPAEESVPGSRSAVPGAASPTIGPP